MGLGTPVGTARRASAPPARPLDLAVVGHVVVDHLVSVARLPARDRTVPALARSDELGGTAANLALAAAGFGVRTALISRVGVDFPPSFRARLATAGIDLRGLERVSGATSSTCIIVHDAAGEQMTVIDQGPLGDAHDAPIPDAVISQSSWVHLGTGDPAYLRRIQRRARELGRSVAFDPAQEIHYRWDRRRLQPVLAAAEMLFGNDHEIAAVVRLTGAGSVRRLLDIVPTVVMTRGARGARAYFRGGQVDVPSVRVPHVADPTGAGDAFRGGFYAGWFAGEPLPRCLSAGSRAAASWLRGRAVNRRKG
ncbi:MAG TPA: PfkB family carbohydrate kinase [Thermoplasmata archaeon]|nr:PfkB family carbohydrate kinase [Thermoplasmata archaeon]